jgi:FMN phosphatase YigB (HAD superfamily)
MIKVLILDQEGTIYKNRDIFDKIKKNMQEFFCEEFSIEKKDYKEWYLNNKRAFPNIFNLLKEFNISIEKYHSKIFGNINPKEHLKKDNSLINKIKELKITVYVVTSSSKEYSKRVLDALGLSKIIKKSLSISEKNREKIRIYNKILKVEAVSEKEICIIGDNWDTDLKDADEKGFKTIVLKEKDSLIKIIDKINNL